MPKKRAASPAAAGSSATAGSALVTFSARFSRNCASPLATAEAGIVTASVTASQPRAGVEGHAHRVANAGGCGGGRRAGLGGFGRSGRLAGREGQRSRHDEPPHCRLPAGGFGGATGSSTGPGG